MRLFKQLLSVFLVLTLAVAALLVFAFDVIKIDWISFMEIQPSFDYQEQPLAVPAKSIPVEGPAYIPGGGAPLNPVPADDISISRGKQLFGINCQLCHGDQGHGDGPIAAFLIKKKPADLAGALVQSLPDGSIFLTISNGKFNPDNTLFTGVNFSGQMPPLNENLTVRERWDIVNYVRTLKPAQP
jgi:mono/diheme cytochrome c family protein